MRSLGSLEVARWHKRLGVALSSKVLEEDMDAHARRQRNTPPADRAIWRRMRTDGTKRCARHAEPGDSPSVTLVMKSYQRPHT